MVEQTQVEQIRMGTARASGRSRPRVISLVCKSLPKYRIPFVEELRLRLLVDGCRLQVLYGPPSSEEQQKEDTGHIDWGERIPTRVIRLGSRQLYWQSCLRRVWGSDLVVVEQASKLLLNYALLALQTRGGPPTAFWGHGRNLQPHTASPTGELIKRRVSRYPHWWFAYTEGSAAIVRALGFPADRITVVQNAIDTIGLRESRRRLPPTAIRSLRAQLDLEGSNVGIFIGGLYSGKRLQFLIEAAHVVRRLLPDFELLVLGGGPADAAVRSASEAAPWIHYVGPQFGEAKARFVALAKVLLLPALPGLTVLDSFAFEVPIVTVAAESNPPEFEYLQHDVNAVILPTSSDANAYALQVVYLMQSEDMQARLQANCRLAAERYTLGAMVNRFAAGAVAALTVAPGNERRR